MERLKLQSEDGIDADDGLVSRYQEGVQRAIEQNSRRLKFIALGIGEAAIFTLGVGLAAWRKHHE